MKVLCFLMAQEATVDRGSLSITNVMDRQFAARDRERHNVTWPNCVLVAYIEWRPALDGTDFQIEFRFTTADQLRTIVTLPWPPLAIAAGPSGRPVRLPVTPRIHGLVLPGCDDYLVELRVNGAVLATLDFYLDKLP